MELYKCGRFVSNVGAGERWGVGAVRCIGGGRGGSWRWWWKMGCGNGRWGVVIIQVWSGLKKWQRA